ncbi:chemotaxis response regulator protein-glutamate methylesterase [Candidatus Halobeggiatoa sp. HSG11]|nr:chemotaxis response regulator protein-glutamate methylesterase [Candidatus Halobeggiatoa sp. HSG11]
MSKIKVLIIDDSALIRQMLTKIINSSHDMEVVGTAGDPYIARRKIKQLNPDVLTLDIEMPRMDGLDFLSNLMRLRPMPVIMISALTEKGANTTLQALEYGAIDFITKPQLDISNTFGNYAEEILAKLRLAAKIKVHAYSVKKKLTVPPKYSADVIIKHTSIQQHFETTDKIIAIGASTGGTEAIRALLNQIPPDTAGIVISQHIPINFSRSFAIRMNQISAMTVCETKDKQAILPGHVYIAPGDSHLLVKRYGARYVCSLNQGEAVNRHRPSVDVLFRSVAQNVGPNAIGIILTGMGDDGARGIKEMHDAGAVTIAQDKKTSVVWGMPGEAVKRGGIDHVLPLHAIADKLINILQRKK